MTGSFILPLLALLSSATLCMAESDSTHVKIIFETYTETQNVHIQLDNGQGLIEARISFNNNTFLASTISEVAYIGVLIRIIDAGKPICAHRFWVGKGQAEIRFLAKSNNLLACPLDNFKLTNAIDVQYQDQKFSEFISKETTVLDSIVKSAQARFAGGDTLVHQSEGNFKSMISAKEKIFARKLIYFQNHPDAYSFAKFSETIFNADGTLEPSIVQVFESFPQRFQQSPEGQEVLRTIGGKTQHEGSMALDYKTIDIQGTPLSLASLKGKYVLMVFWATWCGPCREEIPTIKSLHSRYKDSEKLVVISFAKHDNLSKVKNFIAAQNVDWLQVVNDDRILKEYGVWAVPKTVLIDLTGKIAVIEEGSDISRIVDYLGEKNHAALEDKVICPLSMKLQTKVNIVKHNTNDQRL